MSLGAPELLIILAIAALLFGTKKIRSLGSDLGGALRGFRKAMSDEGTSPESAEPPPRTGASEPSDKKDNQET